MTAIGLIALTSVFCGEAIEPVPAPDLARLQQEFESDALEPAAAPNDNVTQQLLQRAFAQAVDGRSAALTDLAYVVSEPVRGVVDAMADGNAESARDILSVNVLPAVLSTNVRQYLAETLVRVGAYDNALELLDDSSVDATKSVDPAELFFVMAVARHAKLDKENGLPILERLLAPESVVPDRYRSLARLMKQDLEDLDDNELAQTARQMRNLQQQLQQGRSGKPQQQQEKEILQQLDKLIEKLQQQQQQAQGQGGAPAGGQPQTPADESQIGGMKGPGEVDRKPIGKSSGWGELPEKARTDARNLINRRFPSHYRRAVEEYLKKLADRPAK